MSQNVTDPVPATMRYHFLSAGRAFMGYLQVAAEFRPAFGGRYGARGIGSRMQGARAGTDTNHGRLRGRKLSVLRDHWRLAVLLAFAAGVGLYFFSGAEMPLVRVNRDSIGEMVARAGIWGPVLVVVLMVLAVVASPIPSAPIALAAGAAYGHGVGTVLVLAGAEAGALIAFAIARLLGRDMVQRLLGERIGTGLLGSQNALMLTVFASRLMPFVSFDMVSYAAGLSMLTFWRFAGATLAGIVPASFVLAHLGGQAVDDPTGAATVAVLGLGLITGAPLLLVLFRRHRHPAPAGQIQDIENGTGVTVPTQERPER
jgi:uncharacterized membrane protein YdjX (TVP38/TMEM64 family)